MNKDRTEPLKPIDPENSISSQDEQTIKLIKEGEEGSTPAPVFMPARPNRAERRARMHPRGYSSIRYTKDGKRQYAHERAKGCFGSQHNGITVYSENMAGLSRSDLGRRADFMEDLAVKLEAIDRGRKPVRKPRKKKVVDNAAATSLE